MQRGGSKIGVASSKPAFDMRTTEQKRVAEFEKRRQAKAAAQANGKRRRVNAPSAALQNVTNYTKAPAAPDGKGTDTRTCDPDTRNARA